MSDSFAIAVLIVFVAGIAAIEHHPILAFALVILAMGIIK